MRILICAAGSGGHIYPALSLAQCLSDSGKNIQIFFLSNEKTICRQIFAENPYKVFTADFISPYRGRSGNPFKFFLKNLGFLIKFNTETLKVFFLILKTKPDAVIGFGGIISIAAIAVCRMLSIPTLIHEQNIIPGKANRFISRITTKVAVGFDKTRQYLRHDAVFTGNPIRRDLKKIDKTIACNTLGLQPDLFTILVFGGSQGAEAVNKSFTQAIAEIDNDLRDNLNIIHISGEKDVSALTDFYQKLKIKAKIFAYCANMSNVYSAADLLIGRAGAGTINEVCFLGIPAVFIPYPYAGGHQKINAEFMQKNGAACVVPENDLTAVHLQENIKQLMENKDILKNMGVKSRELFMADADARLAEIVLNMVKQGSKNN